MVEENEPAKSSGSTEKASAGKNYEISPVKILPLENDGRFVPTRICWIESEDFDIRNNRNETPENF